MTVYDQWHRDDGDSPCGCGTKRTPLYPSSRHRQGDRWQVRWRDPAGRQRKRNFAAKVGTDPGRHADAFDAQVRRELDAGAYTDPALREGTFGAYALQWLALQSHDSETARAVRARLWWHVLEDPASPGRTRRGGPALGHLTWARLGRYPSLTQAWIAGLSCAASTASRVVTVASSVFASAAEDGLIARNPVASRSVKRPRPAPGRAVPWTAERTAAVAAGLPPRWRAAMAAGQATAARKGEVLALAAGDVSWLARPGEHAVTLAVQVKRGPDGGMRFAPRKNRKSSVVPVPDELVALLAAHLRDHPAAEVTLPWHDERDPRRHGQPVTRLLLFHDDGAAAIRPWHWDRRAWRPALQAAGLIGSRKEAAAGLGTHAAWRHTAVSAWLDGGASIADVAEWTGDSAAVIWRTYAHVMPGAAARGRAASAARMAAVSEASCAPDVPRQAAGGGKPQRGGGGG